MIAADDKLFVTVKGMKPGTYRVHLTFAEPTDDPHRCDIRLQGRTVAKDFASGGKMIGTIKSFANIESTGSIMIELTARTGRAQLSGIEIIPADPPE